MPLACYLWYLTHSALPTKRICFPLRKGWVKVFSPPPPPPHPLPFSAMPCSLLDCLFSLPLPFLHPLLPGSLSLSLRGSSPEVWPFPHGEASSCRQKATWRGIINLFMEPLQKITQFLPEKKAPPFKFYLYFILCAFCLHVCLCTACMLGGGFGGKKKKSNLLDQKLQVVVKHHENAGNRATRECSLLPSYLLSPRGASL